MLGILKQEAIETLISRQLIGHLGCTEDQTSYVVPISYAYDGEFIYCHTHEGRKIKIMRKNPKVCFEIDRLEDLGNWESVVIQGIFEELSMEEREKALRILVHRSLPINSSVTTHLGAYWPFSQNDTKIDGIVFRIRIREKTGRYEFNGASHDFPG
jgi:nitroimidazol reductase NimA-like FMN-containing flavoprotein (pyridoxamine 5'-phosphate oxidase superfamily)